MPAGQEFSGSKLRERDKRVLETHQLEIKELHQRLENSKHEKEEVWRKFFDVNNVATRIAAALGFSGPTEAQEFIDKHDGATSYRDCIERYKAVEMERDDAVGGMEALREENERLKAENESLKSQWTQARKDSQQLAHVQTRYNQLLSTHGTTKTRLEETWTKWQKFKDWLFGLEETKPGLTPEQKNAEVYKYFLRKWQKTMKVGRDGVPADFLKVAEEDIKEHAPVMVKKPVDTPRRESSSHPSPLNPSSKANQDSSSTPLSGKIVAESKPLAQIKDEDVFLNPNTLVTPPRSGGIKRSFAFANTGSSAINDTPAMTLVALTSPMIDTEPVPTSPLPPSSPASSETETETQPLCFPPRRLPPPPTAPPASSTRTPLTFEPIGASGSPISNRRRSDIGVTSGSGSETQSDANDEHVRKYRRVSEGSNNTSTRVPSPVKDESMIDLTHIPTSSPSPVPIPAPSPSSRPPVSTGRRAKVKAKDREKEKDKENDQTPKSSRTVNDNYTGTVKGKGKGKGKGKEKARDEEISLVTPVSVAKTAAKGKQKDDGSKSTPATATGTKGKDKGAIDYSVYKGRGRYGKEAAAANEQDKTLNALYAINPERNDGLDYQFENVERNKEKRKRLDAGDCECCREYYEAIGPMPPRLQPPLWRSPTNSPVSQKRTNPKRPKPCPHHSQSTDEDDDVVEIDDSFGSQPPKASTSRAHGHASASTSSRKKEKEKQKEIESHRQTVSRHRKEWARGNTPPRFWEIGLPNTQEVADINELAMEQHRRKMEMAERESRKKDGKYVRRR